MKRTVTLPLVWLILILVQVQAHSEEKQRGEVVRQKSALTKAIVQVRPSVVQINVEFRNYPERTQHFFEELSRQRAFGLRIFSTIADFAVGTGFLVNEGGYVVTAKHVIDSIQRFSVDGMDAWELGERSAFVGIQTPDMGELPPEGGSAAPGTLRGAFTGEEFEVIDEDPIHDLALLKLKHNPFTVYAGGGVIETPHGPVKILQIAPAQLSLARPDEGEPIAVSGYPLESSTLITTSGAIASSWSVNTGPPGGALHLSDAYMADMRVNPGNSGGPVFSISDGSVIGVCVSFENDLVRDSKTGEFAELNNHNLSYNSGLSFVVPAKYIVELLRKNHLRWAETTHDPRQP